MSSGRANSGTVSEPTSTSGPTNGVVVDENEYLQKQTADAQKAIAEAVQKLKVAVADKANPRQLMRKFPFVTLGSTIAVGFVAAVVAIPSWEQQELKRLERIRRAMHPELAPKPAAKNAGTGEAPAKGPLWLSITKEVLQAVRPMLTALVTAKLAEGKQQSADANKASDPS